MTLVLGVDPGLSGGLAALTAAGDLVQVADLPVMRDGRLSWIDGGQLQSLLIDLAAGRTARAVVERVSARPAQGIASAFNFGAGLGSLLAVLQARGIGIELVTPAKWKRDLGLSGDKRASLDKARLLYPSAELTLAKHEGRAEALLMAHWALCRGAA